VRKLRDGFLGPRGQEERFAFTKPFHLLCHSTGGITFAMEGPFCSRAPRERMETSSKKGQLGGGKGQVRRFIACGPWAFNHKSCQFNPIDPGRKKPIVSKRNYCGLDQTISKFRIEPRRCWPASNAQAKLGGRWPPKRQGRGWALPDRTGPQFQKGLSMCRLRAEPYFSYT